MYAFYRKRDASGGLREATILETSWQSWRIDGLSGRLVHTAWQPTLLLDVAKHFHLASASLKGRVQYTLVWLVRQPLGTSEKPAVTADDQPDSSYTTLDTMCQK